MNTPATAKIEPYATSPERGTVYLERLLPGPIERVWDYVTNSEKRAKWFAGGPMELRVGGKATLNFDHRTITPEPIPERYKACVGLVSHGHVTRCEAPRLLAFTWWEDSGDQSEITFDLTPQDGKVLLKLTHRRLEDLNEMKSVSGGWHAHIMALEEVLSGQEVDTFYRTLEVLNAYYDERLTAANAPA